jgi:hypothetical protein
MLYSTTQGQGGPAYPNASTKIPCRLHFSAASVSLPDGSRGYLYIVLRSILYDQAAGVLFSAGIVISPAIGVLLMSAGTVIVAINARLLRLRKEDGRGEG